MNITHENAKWGFSWLILYKLVIFRDISQKFGIKCIFYFILFNCSVNFHSKICTLCWNVNKSWRGCFLRTPNIVQSSSVWRITTSDHMEPHRITSDQIWLNSQETSSPARHQLWTTHWCQIVENVLHIWC